MVQQSILFRPIPDSPLGMLGGLIGETTVKYRSIIYKFGGKDISTGTADCSHFVAVAATGSMQMVNQRYGLEIFPKSLIEKFATGAAYQYINLSQIPNAKLASHNKASMKPGDFHDGMVLFTDNGNQGWDADRPKGIDHVLIVSRINGKLCVSESTGRELRDPGESNRLPIRDGVTWTPLEKWIEKAKNNPALKFLGSVDLMSLADPKMLALANIGAGERIEQKFEKSAAWNRMFKGFEIMEDPQTIRGYLKNGIIGKQVIIPQNVTYSQKMLCALETAAQSLPEYQQTTAVIEVARDMERLGDKTLIGLLQNDRHYKEALNSQPLFPTPFNLQTNSLSSIGLN